MVEVPPVVCMIYTAHPSPFHFKVCCAQLPSLQAGVYDPRRIIGVTTLDITRANTFVAGGTPKPSAPPCVRAHTIHA